MNNEKQLIKHAMIKVCHSPFIFKYQPLPLNKIRILTLHPGEFDHPIVISLHECNLGTVQCAYEALSYVWGNPTRKVPIKCNGNELYITKNLYIAIRRLRSRSEQRMLWVDAICINQDNLEEREQQVPRMKEIYAKADKVIVWLREADKKTELAIKAIHEWSSFNRNYQHKSNAARFSEFQERFTRKPGYSDKLEALGALTHRPWFNRCWAFQEIILSTSAEILVGEFSLNWEYFYQAIRAFPINLLADSILNFNALFMCYGKAKVGNTASADLDTIPVSLKLSKVLEITRNLTASNPRDNIYSVLSVAEMKDPSNFHPNYSLPVRETFIKLTLAMIRDENSLHVIMSCGEKKRDKHLPSWCPDWSCKRGVTLTGYFDYISYDINAGLNPDFRTLDINEHCELELDGALIDVVDKVFDLETLENELKVSLKKFNFTSVLSKFARKIGLQNYQLQDNLSPEATILRTLSADHWFFNNNLISSYKELWFPTHLRYRGVIRKRSNKITTTSPASSVSDISTMIDFNISHPRTLNHDQDSNSISYCESENLNDEIDNSCTHAVINKVYRQTSPSYNEGQDFDEAEHVDERELASISKEAITQAIFFSKGKRFLITKHGLLAISTDQTREGDIVCSFWGSDVPFVLRERVKIRNFYKKNQNNATFKMIGECYINGFMYGEFFRVMSEGHKNQEKRQNIKAQVDWIKLRSFKIT